MHPKIKGMVRLKNHDFFFHIYGNQATKSYSSVTRRPEIINKIKYGESTMRAL